MKKTNAKKTTQSPTNNTKLPNINKTSKSPKEDTKSTKKGKPNEKKVNNPPNLKTEAKEENKEAQKKKMEELKERKKKRMEKEKKEEPRDKQLYEQIVKEFQDNKTRVNTETNVVKRLTNAKKESDINSLNSMQLPQIKISEKKTQAILEESGMLDAYKYLIIQLCKNGFPTTNLFEYSAFVIKNYEKKWKEKKSKMTKEKVEKYWQEKKEELKNMEKKNNNSIEDQNKIKALNRSFEEREINKLIKNMDKSRSSIHKQEFPVFKKNKSEEKKTEEETKLKIAVNQKEGNKGKKDNKTRINTETNVIKRLTNSKKESELNSLNSMQLPQIKISEKKTQAILEESGMLDAYKYLIIQLCKNGFPTSNLFEYSAFVIKNYEKKWKEKKSKMTKEKVEKYWQEKKEQLKNLEKKNTNSIEDQNKMKALNRSFEEREINKLIKSLDKSRSSRHKQEFPVFNKNKSEENKTEDDKLKVSVPQKESNKGKKDNKAKSKSPDNKTKTKQPDKKTNEKSPQPQKKTDVKKKK